MHMWLGICFYVKHFVISATFEDNSQAEFGTNAQNPSSYACQHNTIGVNLIVELLQV